MDQENKILKRKSALLVRFLALSHWDSYARNLISDLLYQYRTGVKLKIRKI